MAKKKKSYLDEEKFKKFQEAFGGSRMSDEDKEIDKLQKEKEARKKALEKMRGN